MSTSAQMVSTFLSQYPDAVLFTISAQKYNIPLVSAAVASSPYILTANSVRQSLGFSTPPRNSLRTGGIVQRQPVLWNFYVASAGLQLFDQILDKYTMHR